MHDFVIFCSFDICVQAWGALRDLNNFFLTNNLRFVKYFLAWRNSLLEPAKYKSRKSHISCIISVCYDHFGIILSYFEVFWDLCLSTKSSAGFQKIFFDKPSETCQIFSSLEEFSAGASKIQKSKITHFMHYISIYRIILHNFVMFWSFWDLCVSTESSAGFQKIFFWQTIWDLSNIF